MEDCLDIIGEGTETQMDILLTVQIKCQIIKNQLSCYSTGDGGGHGGGQGRGQGKGHGGGHERDGGEQSNSKSPSDDLITALLQKLIEIQQSLSHSIQSQCKITPNPQFYF